jgi:putative ABC transport system permease protein
LAILVGVVFGTYPAMRASKLDPVEAIRREW